jgi:TolB protein
MSMPSTQRHAPSERQAGLGPLRTRFTCVRLMAVLWLGAIPALAVAEPASAALNQSIDLVSTGLIPQQQGDARWGGFPIGPSQLVAPIADPAKAVNIARCGCALTSLSTVLEQYLAAGRPLYPHYQFAAGGFEQELSFSPKYLDDFLNIGPNLASPKFPGWGYSAGGGLRCGVGVWPWALRRVADVLLVPGSTVEISPTGMTWVQQGNTPGALADVDRALLAGRPSMIWRTIVGGGGLHANLIVGWDNTKKKYLVYDPMWAPETGAKVAGYHYADGATENERYTKYMAAIQTVFVLRPFINGAAILSRGAAARSGGGGSSDWLVAGDAAGDPVRLRLTDPRGRRTGYDPATASVLQESPDASYSDFTSFADPLGALAEAVPLRYVAVQAPEAGTYALAVMGTADGRYSLALSTVTGIDQQVAASVTGTIAAGQTERYEVTRTTQGAVTMTAVDSFAPSARAGNDAYGYAGSSVRFDGRGSNQPDGAISGYDWSFGDGTVASGAHLTHAYAAPGTYTATLTVTGAGGRVGTDSRTLTIVTPPAHPKETVRVNETSTGDAADATTWYAPDVTPDGRYVAFTSRADNLVAGDTNAADDIFVKDLQTGGVERVSVSSLAAESDGASAYPSISADGRFVAFFSSATTLGGANPGFYVRDRHAGTTEYIARGAFGNTATISDDGRYVAIWTPYPVVPDGGSNDRVYVYDRQAASFQEVGVGRDARLSGDGSFVAYTGSDLATGYRGVLAYDRVAMTTAVASVSSLGTPIPGAAHPSISDDGRYVAFDVNNAGAQGSPPPPYDKPDVYLRDRQTATTEKVNTGFADGGASIVPTVSPGGRFVAFVFGANLSLATTFHLYVHDRVEDTVEEASVATDGAVGSVPYGYAASLTTAGDAVFWSFASNLIADDANALPDIFMRRLLPPSGAPGPPLANLGGPYAGWATSAEVPASIRLDGSASVDPGGRAMTAHWDFGDGTATVDGALQISHAYAQPGVYDVTLTVRAGADTSAPVHTEVEVLAPPAAATMSVPACVAPGAPLAIEGSAVGANAALIAQGWDTSAGPVSPAGVSVTLPWGQIQAQAVLPSLTFTVRTTVPPGTADGAYSATVTGASAAFAIPCATVANQPPIAVAGGPTYSGRSDEPVRLDGSRSTDPEGARLTYAWDFGDGTSGTGATPAHHYAAAGAFMVTLVVNDGTADSVTDIGSHSFAQVIVSTPPAAPVAGPPAPTATALPVSPDAACANDRLRLTDVYPDRGRVRFRGVAPSASRGQTVLITSVATRKAVARAVVGTDLSFAATAPLPARRLRTSNRTRYVASIGTLRSPALKLARRMFLTSVIRSADRILISGRVVKPLARAAKDRRVLLRLATGCARGARQRTVIARPRSNGAFKATVRLTAAERSAAALYVRGQSRVRRTARSRRSFRTFTLTRGVA